MSRFIYLVTLVLLLVACGSGTQKPGHGPDPDGAHSPDPGDPHAIQESESVRGDSDYAPQAAAPPSDEGAEGAAAEDYAAEQAPATAAPRSGAYRHREPSVQRQRPGLGTQWGETRYSQVHSTRFMRDSQSPISVAEIRYDDARGVRAMLGSSSMLERDNRVWIAGGAVEARIVDENGHAYHGTVGGERAYVVGEHGARYQIQLINHSPYRYEVVASVDGLDVVDGETASMSKRGYVLNAHGSLTIDGFRRSMDQVAAFRFGATDDSYASRKGKGRNVGVIGIALFNEAGARPLDYDEAWRRETADPFPGRFSEPPPPHPYHR